jgi:hypothetical protein
MFEPAWQRTVLLAVIVLGPWAPDAAKAQDPFGLPGDLLLLKTREWQLRHDRDRLQADIDRADNAALLRDLNRVRRDQRRIEWERWNLRSDLFLPLAFTTHPKRIPPVSPNPTLLPHPQYPGYGYFPSDPDHLYRFPQPTSPASTEGEQGASTAAESPAQVPIEIVNAGPANAGLDYFVDGFGHRLEPGARQKLNVGATSTIAYNRGQNFGSKRYSLAAGVYEFRLSESGWELFKLEPAR